MSRLPGRFSRSVAGTAVLSVLFFVLYYLYLWRAVDLRLIYHGGGVITNFPVFYRGWEFFQRFLLYPGGLVEYLSAFAAQFFYIGWAGAMVATVQAWLLWACTGLIVRVACGRQIRWVRFAGPVLLLSLYARYSYPFGVAMGILLAMGFAYLYMVTVPKAKAMNLPVFLVLSIIFYAATGGNYLLFAAICGLYEMLLRRRLVLGSLFLASAAIIAHTESIIIFNISVIDIFSDFIPQSYEVDIVNLTVFYVLYLLLPITLVVLWLAGLLRSNTGGVKASSKSAEKTEQSRHGKLTWWSEMMAAGVFAPLLAIIAGSLVGYFNYKDAAKALMAIDYYASNKLWSKVIEVSGRHPQNQYICHSLDRALYHTGRLGDDIFVYEQVPGAIMLSKETGNSIGWWRLFDTYIDLGHMNLAESMLSLCLDTHGERPVILKRLALVNMVKGNKGAATVYLKVLSKTLFDAKWACDYLRKIERDPNLSTDEQVQRLRSMMPEKDREFKSLNDNMFLDLLDRNRNNKMAFEYLAAYYLLTNQRDKFAGILDRLDDFDYVSIPRAYEEAILLHSYITKKKIELPGREISRESYERFDGFNRIYLGRYGANKLLALDELAKNYGDTYFFYYVYGRSGMKK